MRVVIILKIYIIRPIWFTRPYGFRFARSHSIRILFPLPSSFTPLYSPFVRTKTRPVNNNYCYNTSNGVGFLRNFLYTNIQRRQNNTFGRVPVPMLLLLLFCRLCGVGRTAPGAERTKDVSFSATGLAAPPRGTTVRARVVVIPCGIASTRRPGFLPRCTGKNREKEKKEIRTDPTLYRRKGEKKGKTFRHRAQSLRTAAAALIGIFFFFPLYRPAAVPTRIRYRLLLLDYY